MTTILVLHGPNLNLLGSREPQHYGQQTLQQIDNSLIEKAKKEGHQLSTAQHNSEHELIEAIHSAKNQGVDFIIFNPAAFTHTSIALRDALLAVGIPFIEVHLSNPYQRDEFRKHSYFSDIAAGVISGFGAHSYMLALQFVIQNSEN